MGWGVIGYDSDEIERKEGIQLSTGCEGDNMLVSRNGIQILTWCEGNNRWVSKKKKEDSFIDRL